MPRRFSFAALVAVTALGYAATASAQVCTGDCDTSHNVTVDEVVTGVNIALGARNLSECTAFDSTNDGSVTVDELLQAVNNALDGCPPPSTPPTRTPTATATQSPTPTQPVEPGPLITYFGIATAQNRVPTPIGIDDLGRQIFQPFCRSGFFIVVEARSNPNTGNLDVGRVTLDSDLGNPAVRPDLQLLASNGLGNGSEIVCDHNAGLGSEPPFGGVPGFNLLDFDPNSQAVANALNDIGCRFRVHTVLDPCTTSAFGTFRFVNAQTSIQFCSELTVDAFWAFPVGDTVLAVQLRDFDERLGHRQEIVIRPANDCGAS
jgi:hypothetical protein